jgi:hypothetical protein
VIRIWTARYCRLPYATTKLCARVVRLLVTAGTPQSKPHTLNALTIASARIGPHRTIRMPLRFLTKPFPRCNRVGRIVRVSAFLKNAGWPRVLSPPWRLLTSKNGIAFGTKRSAPLCVSRISGQVALSLPYTGGRLCPHTCWRPAFRKRKYFRTNSPSRAASGPPQIQHGISPSLAVSGPASALTT